MSLIKTLVVRPETKVRLKKIDPDFTNSYKDEAEIQDRIKIQNQELRTLQYHLYAENKRSVLIVLQGMDAAGKDGTVRAVLDVMNPLGTCVYSFKSPTAEELAHDFLWRVHKQTPSKGELKVFNRSHYEDVLITRVHDLVPKSVWSKRYGMINEFERLLTKNGTRILKFYLHIDPEEQLRRFEQRLTDPLRQWKISEADYSERKFWPEYTKAYEDCIEKTNTEHAPWFIIPANKKWFRNYAVGKIVKHAMEDMKMTLPKPTVDIKDIRRKYELAVVQSKKKK